MDNKSIKMRTLEFLNKSDLEDQLVSNISTKLISEIKTKGRASLLVSGGSTPIHLFQKLSNVNLPWKKVTVGLVDERFVPTNNKGSNEKLVRENLLMNYASDTTFIGMVYYTNDVFKNLEEAEKKYGIFSSGATVTILGMGEDGHTASLFPGNNSSQKDLKGENELLLLNTISPSEPRRRVSCGKDLLLSSKNIYLMMVGENKLAVFNQAHLLKLPISYFISSIETYYAPKM